jgi:DNA-binding CsgD family transcriptional regulator
MKTLSITKNHNSLSPRERQIVKLLVDEYSTREIASHLNIAYETVKSHKKHIMWKLNVNSVAGIVREAFYQGIIPINKSSDLVLKRYPYPYK